jgi:hypothetical protein
MVSRGELSGKLSLSSALYSIMVTRSDEEFFRRHTTLSTAGYNAVPHDLALLTIGLASEAALHEVPFADTYLRQSAFISPRRMFPRTPKASGGTAFGVRGCGYGVSFCYLSRGSFASGLEDGWRPHRRSDWLCVSRAANAGENSIYECRPVTSSHCTTEFQFISPPAITTPKDAFETVSWRS